MLDNPDLNIKHELHMFKQIKTNGWLQYTEQEWKGVGEITENTITSFSKNKTLFFP